MPNEAYVFALVRMTELWLPDDKESLLYHGP
jgi:hypothetical protein